VDFSNVTRTEVMEGFLLNGGRLAEKVIFAPKFNFGFET